MSESGAVGLHGFPNRIVQIGRALADRSVELGRDETWLAFHEFGVVRPRIEKGLLLGGIYRDQIYEHNRRGINVELAVNRNLSSSGLRMGMRGLRLWF